MHDKPTRPSDRSLIARIAAHERWAKTPDRSAATAPARAGVRQKFARELDPAGTMPPDELERRIDNAVHAHMLRMSLAAKNARRAKRAG